MSQTNFPVPSGIDENPPVITLSAESHPTLHGGGGGKAAGGVILTPETDSWCGWGIGGMEVVPASFTRDLERRLIQCREALQYIADQNECLTVEIARNTLTNTTQKQ